MQLGVFKVWDHEGRILNRVIVDISNVLWETSLTVSDSIETGSPVESEIVRVVSLSTTEITEITRSKKTILGSGNLNVHALVLGTKSAVL